MLLISVLTLADGLCRLWFIYPILYWCWCAKAFRTFIRVYFLFKTEILSSNIKLILYKAPIRSVMTYACPAWEFAADTHLIKLQHLQNTVLRNIGNFPRRTPVHETHMLFTCRTYMTI
jgi:hypothetical protein